MPLWKYSALVLSVFCLGCAQVPAPGYSTGGHQAASATPRAGGPQVAQGVGFSTGTGTAASVQAAPAEASGANTAVTSGAAVLAVLGLVALILIADEGAACAGSLCASSE